jgi:hypothetical protein
MFAYCCLNLQYVIYKFIFPHKKLTTAIHNEFLGVTICSTTLSAMCYLFYYTECSFLLVSFFFMILDFALANVLNDLSFLLPHHLFYLQPSFCIWRLFRYNKTLKKVRNFRNIFIPSPILFFNLNSDLLNRAIDSDIKVLKLCHVID